MIFYRDWLPVVDGQRVGGTVLATDHRNPPECAGIGVVLVQIAPRDHGYPVGGREDPERSIERHVSACGGRGGAKNPT